ncbi:hypothetical protein Bhyg_17358, partial [Pseudolycoriella hygida]
GLFKQAGSTVSIGRNAAYCFPCRAFDVSGTKETAFVTTGATNWKKAMEKKQGFHHHETTFHHISAMTAWEEKRIRSGNSEKLRECQRVIPENCTYLSPDIQNEIISIIVQLVEEEIVSEINSSDVDFFTIIVDGTKDRKNREIVSIAICYVRNGKPIESLLGFETTKELDAKSEQKFTLLFNGKSILKLIETRWAGHVRATNAVFQNLQIIVDTLSEVIENNARKFDPDDIAMANGIKQAILKREFLFMVTFI